MPRVSLDDAARDRAEALVFQVPSSRDAAVLYTVRMEWDGTWSCDCPGYRYRFQCRHVEEQLASFQRKLRERDGEDIY